ncbi:MAG TPA: bifunctional hydroxymethylpyrimidine kinase/phosphomethylpyrimidine kinase [Candidatus Krumholzibacteria bacterium]|nr:bifunctional hydroxymethylpyrimidine kinase/phosphomethylpyrimidine kinase [Candidatus Krumholzibacteria bacterium]
MKQALTIAGSDSGGGAGIQADLKTFHAHGVFGTSVITAVTAQNTKEVRHAFDLPPELVRAQLEAVLDDFDIAAAKTGMLSSAAIIDTVADVLEARRFEKLVVDPVMISKSGFRLLRDDAIDALVRRLAPRALVVTPNLHEASLLAAMPIESLDDMKRAAEKIGELGARAVVVKGGHARFALAVDVLWHADGTIEVLHPEGEVAERSVHGTGCTFSAAITARIARGEDVATAVRNAKRYITRVIRHAVEPGRGHAVGDAFYFLEGDDWERE